jgi:hypothetical protein
MNKKKAQDLDTILNSLFDGIGDNPVKRVSEIIKTADLKYLRELQSILIDDQLVYSGDGSDLRPLKIVSKGTAFLHRGGYVKKLHNDKAEKINENIKIFGVIIAALVGIITLTLAIINYTDNKSKSNERLDKIEMKLNNLKK